MAYLTLCVANYFIDISKSYKKYISPMKLQKLIYYAHGWHLAITGEPLINEYVEIRNYGPVIQSIYSFFAGYGNGPIKKRAWILDGANNNLISPVFPISKDSNNVKKLLNKIWEVYGGLTATQLANSVHQPQTPWFKIWGQDGVSNGTIIPNKMIEQFFIEKAAK